MKRIRRIQQYSELKLKICSQGQGWGTTCLRRMITHAFFCFKNLQTQATKWFWPGCVGFLVGFIELNLYYQNVSLKPRFGLKKQNFSAKSDFFCPTFSEEGRGAEVTDLGHRLKRDIWFFFTPFLIHDSWSNIRWCGHNLWAHGWLAVQWGLVDHLFFCYSHNMLILT